jgi:hypothetical protein
MAQADLERLIGKAILDPQFRDRFLDDPGRVAREEGLSLTDEEIAGLESVDKEKAKDLADQMTGTVKSPWAS